MGFEVVGIGFVSTFFAVGDSGESFLNRTVTNVECRVGCSHPDAEFHSIVIIDDCSNFIFG
jgi:hypothetical protein